MTALKHEFSKDIFGILITNVEHVLMANTTFSDRLKIPMSNGYKMIIMTKFSFFPGVKFYNNTHFKGQRSMLKILGNVRNVDINPKLEPPGS